jgi:hypothetical protein
MRPTGRESAGVARTARYLTPRVLVLNYDPIIEAEGGKRLNALLGFHDPRYLCAGYIADIRACSGGHVATTSWNGAIWTFIPSRRTAFATPTSRF